MQVMSPGRGLGNPSDSTAFAAFLPFRSLSCDSYKEIYIYLWGKHIYLSSKIKCWQLLRLWMKGNDFFRLFYFLFCTHLLHPFHNRKTTTLEYRLYNIDYFVHSMQRPELINWCVHLIPLLWALRNSLHVCE